MAVYALYNTCSICAYAENHTDTHICNSLIVAYCVNRVFNHPLYSLLNQLTYRSSRFHLHSHLTHCAPLPVLRNKQTHDAHKLSANHAMYTRIHVHVLRNQLTWTPMFPGSISLFKCTLKEVRDVIRF